MDQIDGILEAEKGFYGRSRWVGGGKGLYGWVVYGRVLGKRVIGRGLYTLQFLFSTILTLWFLSCTLLSKVKRFGQSVLV